MSGLRSEPTGAGARGSEVDGSEVGSLPGTMMPPQAGREVPRFAFRSPRVHLSATGIGVRVTAARWADGGLPAAAEAAFETARARGLPPLIVGALPFLPGQPGHLFVPERVTWMPPEGQTPADSARDLVPAEAGRGREPQPAVAPDPAFQRAVRRALSALDSKAIDKVVLSRQHRVALARGTRAQQVFARLSAANPSAYRFLMDLPEGAGTLVGASPELVLGAHGRAVIAEPLAGSLPRATDPAADAAAARRLQASAKDQAEHAWVADAVRAAFTRHADDVRTPPDGPALLATPTMWHLATRVTGQLQASSSPLALLTDLHPTPAIGGWPRAAALDLIDRLEPVSRGWFGGVIGWLDAEGRGEWALTLRCGVLAGGEATLFAGAGIVASSDPVAEDAEIRAKLRTFAAALTS